MISEDSCTSASVTSSEFGIVLRGGGAKGLALLGAVSELEARIDGNFTAYAGTSAGGLLALALAAGYTSESLLAIVRAQSFMDFLDADWSPDLYTPPYAPATLTEEHKKPLRASMFISALWRALLLLAGLRKTGGVFSTEPIGRWIQYLMRWRPTSSDLIQIEPNLAAPTTLGSLTYGALTVCSSTGNKTVVLHSSTVTPTVEISFAARTTMAIPGVFEPMLVGKDVLMDGGLVANFPITQFEDAWPSTTPIGIYLFNSDDSTLEQDRSTSLLGTIRSAVAVFFGQDEMKYVQDPKRYIVWADVAPIQTLDFNLDEDDKEFLIACGRLGAIRFLRQNTDIPLRSGSSPTQEEYEALVQTVGNLRNAVRVKWHPRHRRRRLAIFAALLLPPLALLATLVTSILLLSQPDHTGNGTKGVLNIAMVLNGDIEYAQSVGRAIQEELDLRLEEEGYVLRIEQGIGMGPASIPEANRLIFEGTLARFHNSRPDYIITVGTQVSSYARDHYLNEIPIIFTAVTDPVASGIVSSLAPSPTRGNIGGVKYASLVDGYSILLSLFPRARFGYLYDPNIPQDVVVRDTLLAVDRSTRRLTTFPLSTADIEDNILDGVDIFFGWTYMNRHFAELVSKYPKAFVAGNRRDMARGAIAMLASDDDAVGRMAVRDILMPSLKKRVPLSEFPVLVCTQRRLALNRSVALRYGILVTDQVPENTEEFR